MASWYDFDGEQPSVFGSIHRCRPIRRMERRISKDQECTLSIQPKAQLTLNMRIRTSHKAQNSAVNGTSCRIGILRFSRPDNSLGCSEKKVHRSGRNGANHSLPTKSSPIWALLADSWGCEHTVKRIGVVVGMWMVSFATYLTVESGFRENLGTYKYPLPTPSFESSNHLLWSP